MQLSTVRLGAMPPPRKKRGPFVRIRPREITVTDEQLGYMVRDYHTRVMARPFSDRATVALTAWANAVGMPAGLLRDKSDVEAEQIMRQQALVFARLVSEFVQPKTPWLQIGRAFRCGHTNGLYAMNIYGASMRAAFGRIDL